MSKTITIDAKENPNFFLAMKKTISENLLNSYLDAITTKGNKTEKKANLVSNRKAIGEIETLFKTDLNQITINIE